MMLVDLFGLDRVMGLIVQAFHFLHREKRAHQFARGYTYSTADSMIHFR